MVIREIATTNYILSSSNSSIGSNNPSTSSSFSYHGINCEERKRNLSTDLRLGLSISPPDDHCTRSGSFIWDWPPIKPLLRSTLAASGSGSSSSSSSCGGHVGYISSLFVKVYMEGIPIGRKLDLLAHDGYNALVNALSFMFNTTLILCLNDDDINNISGHEVEYWQGSKYVLTYEDKEGDWMMVGDVPWEMFVRNVKRLKITRADRC